MLTSAETAAVSRRYDLALQLLHAASEVCNGFVQVSHLLLQVCHLLLQRHLSNDTSICAHCAHITIILRFIRIGQIRPRP